jgi:hypothetical protein
MPEHDPPRTERLALYMRVRGTEQAARDEAVRVVERWNTALAARRAVVANDPVRHYRRHPLA